MRLSRIKSFKSSETATDLTRLLRPNASLTVLYRVLLFSYTLQNIGHSRTITYVTVCGMLSQYTNVKYTSKVQ